MKKLFEKTAIVLAAVCLTLCMGLFAACGEQEQQGGETVAYTVTVLDPAGEPMKGVKVKWGNIKTEYNTIDNGKATANLVSGDYDISLVGLPEAEIDGAKHPFYQYAPVKATATDRDKTVTLQWNPEEGKVVYTVKVLDPDGKPVKGVRLELCVLADEGGSCTPFSEATNSKGEAYSVVIDKENALYAFGLDPNEYAAKILGGLPTGYTYEQDANGYYTGDKATVDDPVLTIQLKAAE